MEETDSHYDSKDMQELWEHWCWKGRGGAAQERGLGSFARHPEQGAYDLSLRDEQKLGR